MKTMSPTRLLLSLSLSLLVACGDKEGEDTHDHDHDHGDDTGAEGDTQEVVVTFAARFGAQEAACGADLTGVGSTASTVQLQDLRLYVHDLRLVDAVGAEVPVTLADDGIWQDSGVALLDFEDGTGLCANGNSATNAVVVGTAPAGTYEGLRFRVGVPFAVNHQDATLADSPLNLTSLFWAWQSGYKFVRMDLSSEGLPEGWFLHLGSTGCTAAKDGTVTECSAPNRPEVALTMDVAQQVVVADFGALLAASDVNTNAGGAQGCMSAVDDPECPPLLERLGLSGDQGQALFSVE